jgi:TPR repeat protein
MKKVIISLALASTMMFANSFEVAMEQLKNGKDSASLETFLILAKSGNVDAQTMAGEMFLDGIGTKVDHKKAFYWISKAAHNDDAQAEYLLGFMYENGLNVLEDIKRAAKWYEKSASQGDALAKYNLAFIYKEGKGGIEKDMNKAISLLKSIDSSKANYVATSK